MTITLHARNARTNVVLPQAPETKVSELVATIAEVLADTKIASGDELQTLRLAIQSPAGWTDITDQSTSTLNELNVTDETIVGYALNGEAFEYEEIDSDIED